MIIGTRASCLLDSRLPLLTDAERLSTLAKLLSVIILTGGDIEIIVLSESPWSRWRRPKVDVRSLGLCHFLRNLWAIRAWTNCLLDSGLSLFTDSEGLHGPSNLIASIIVLAWSYIYDVFLSKRVRSRRGRAHVDIHSLGLRQ